MRVIDTIGPEKEIAELLNRLKQLLADKGTRT
jgi:hypothetical protein